MVTLRPPTPDGSEIAPAGPEKGKRQKGRSTCAPPTTPRQKTDGGRAARELAVFWGMEDPRRLDMYVILLFYNVVAGIDNQPEFSKLNLAGQRIGQCWRAT